MIKEGWRGRLYEDFEVGDVYEHPLGRTILAADNSWFTLLTMNTNPVHFDANYAESKSRPNAGIVQVKTTGLNQHGAVVIEFKRTFMLPETRERKLV